MPTLHDLGADILKVSPWRRAVELLASFGLCAGFFAAAVAGYYFARHELRAIKLGF